MRFWLGGYTADQGGSAEGIGVLVAGEADAPSAGGPLTFTGTARTAPSPSWIARHPTRAVVYAALEGAGRVAAFARTGETALAALGGTADAGDAVCHVAVAPHGRSLVASCWGDGRVVRVPLDAAGRMGAPAVAPAAHDPYGRASLADPARPDPDDDPGDGDPGDEDPDDAPREDRAERDGRIVDLAAAARALREAAGDGFADLIPDYDRDAESARELRALLGEAAELDATGSALPGSEAEPRVSRAHAAVFLPGGLVATTDLGFDLVRFWRETARGLEPVQEVALPFGSGPRHMVMHPSGHLYVLSEYSCEVFVLARGRDGRWSLRGGTATSPFAAVAGAGGDTGAELVRSHDGEFLYAGLRGSDTIAVLRVQGAGESLSTVALVEAGVSWPRHHAVARDTLLVAGQRSDDVVALTLNIRTGVPGRVVRRASAPSPTCIVPMS